MTPEDLGAYRVPSDPHMRADGRVVFTVTQMDLDDDTYHRNLWIEDAASVRQFTTSNGDSRGRWSPDGRTIAFLRKVGTGAQLATIPAGGGEATVLTEFDPGVEELAWSPDGRTIAVVATTWTDEWSDLDDDERARRPRRITSHPYRFDNMGWTHDRRRHIWLVPVDGSEKRCLTPGDRDERRPAWSPDARTIAFVTDLSEGRGLEHGTDVAEVDTETGEITRAVDRGMWFLASWSPEGALHLLGDPSAYWPGQSNVWRREDDGSLTDLTGQLDRNSASLAAGDPFMHWVGDDVITGLEDSGSFGVVRVEPDGTVHHLMSEPEVVSGVATVDGETLVVTVSTTTEPGVLRRVGPGGWEDLTSFNDHLTFDAGHHFRVPSGGTEIDAWVFLPPGDDPVPGLLNIHGGPASQYGHGFFDEFQVYATAGYAVIACNPRGSSGRGRAHTEAVTGDGWGVVDVEDVGHVVAAALARFPRIDADRLGVMGGSYGGFLTGWLTAHEDRWTSAVVERALLSFPSFAGTSDIGATFPMSYTGADYPDGWGTWWAKSPLSVVDRVTTPTLVLHSEEDHRCPISEAEQWFMALLRNGTETEFLRFPGEGHELSRSGKPRHRQERFEAILAWHARHLRP